MAARAGMANLILELRAATETSATDYTVNGTQYWTDDQLQAELDLERSTFTFVYLNPLPVYLNNAVIFLDYQIPPELGRWVEENGTNSGWAVKDASGVPVGSYAINYRAGIVTFPSDQRGVPYVVDFRTYGLERAAAAVWEMKAAHSYKRVEWQSDNHKIAANQEHDHCLAMAKFWKKKAGPKVSTFIRTDEW